MHQINWRSTSQTRGVASRRLGFTLRSWYSAGSPRTNRLSASTDRRSLMRAQTSRRAGPATEEAFKPNRSRTDHIPIWCKPWREVSPDVIGICGRQVVGKRGDLAVDRKNMCSPTIVGTPARRNARRSIPSATACATTAQFAPAISYSGVRSVSLLSWYSTIRRKRSSWIVTLRDLSTR